MTIVYMREVSTCTNLFNRDFFCIHRAPSILLGASICTKNIMVPLVR